MVGLSGVSRRTTSKSAVAAGVIAEPQPGDASPVVLPRIRAVERDGAGEVVISQPKARVAALDVREPHVEMGPGVVRIQRDRVLEELDGPIVVPEAHHPEAVLEVFLGFLFADVGSAVLPRQQNRGQCQEQQRERQRFRAWSVHAGARI